jgi:hypothetical protein
MSQNKHNTPATCPAGIQDMDLQHLFSEQKKHDQDKIKSSFQDMWHKAQEQSIRQRGKRSPQAKRWHRAMRTGCAVACAGLVLIIFLFSSMHTSSWEEDLVSQAQAISNWQSPTATFLPSLDTKQRASSMPDMINWKTPTDYLFETSIEKTPMEPERSGRTSSRQMIFSIYIG